MPLGWLEVTFELLGEDRMPEQAAAAPQEGAPPPVEDRVAGGAVQQRPARAAGGQPRTIDDLREGQIVEGKVEGIASFGAFVDIGLPFNGLIHISELRDGWVDRVEDVVHPGQTVRVKVINVDRERQRVGLSLKQV
jgi:polyribonucleotide nucleotidyltransferase